MFSSISIISLLSLSSSGFPFAPRLHSFECLLWQHVLKNKSFICDDVIIRHPVKEFQQGRFKQRRFAVDIADVFMLSDTAAEDLPRIIPFVICFFKGAETSIPGCALPIRCSGHLYVSGPRLIGKRTSTNSMMDFSTGIDDSGGFGMD